MWKLVQKWIESVWQRTEEPLTFEASDIELAR